MQQLDYNNQANQWSLKNRDPVVGSFDQHNMWDDYKYIFTPITDCKEKIALDFACGPGRNLVKHQDKFKRLDGVDISDVLIQKAKLYLETEGIVGPLLYTSNGVDLDVIQSNTYDVVMSTIALQHICVHSIRFNIFKDIYRVLKPGGMFTAQMGYGPKTRTKNSVDYYEDNYEAKSTNGQCDTRVESPQQLEDDLLKTGFTNFKYVIGVTGPGDGHPNWIYFNVEKN